MSPTVSSRVVTRGTHTGRLPCRYMGVDLLGPEPIYRQIAADLVRRIRAGEYLPERRIPSEADLCEMYGVSRKTVRAALDILREAGWIMVSEGKGRYVQRRAEWPEED